MRFVVGMFINPLPLRVCQNSCSRELHEIIGTAQRTMSSALQHARTPLHTIIAAMRTVPSTAYAPLYQVMFQVNTLPKEETQCILAIDEPTVKVDLEMQLFYSSGHLEGRLIYDGAIYDEARVRDLVIQYLELLEISCNEHDAPLLNVRPIDTEELVDSIYWREHLREGRLPVLELPLDSPRAALGGGNHVRPTFAPLRLSGNVVEQLQSLKNDLSHALLTVWALLLTRHSQQDEIVVGLLDAATAKASFGSSVAICIHIPHGVKIVDLMDIVRRAWTSAQDHGDLCLRRIRYRANQTQESWHPLFQAYFVWNAARWMAGSATCDIGFHGMVVDSIMEGFMAFRSDLFEREAIDRLASRFSRLATAVATEETTDAWSANCTPDDERQTILFDFNRSQADLPRGMCIHQLMPGDLASHVTVEWHGAQLSFAALQSHATAVANWLCTHGVLPDTRVALQLMRALEQIVGILGTLLSLGSYLPLDSKWPRERRHFIVDDALCGQLIAQSLCDLRLWNCALLLIDDVRRTPMSTLSFAMLHTNALAYVMYTSGSTGKPKGVLVQHDGVVNLLLGSRLRYHNDASAIFGVPTPYVFDVSVYNFFSSMFVHCGTLRLLQDGTALAILHQDDDMTRTSAVPSILAIARLPTLVKQVEVGGEALTQNAIDNVPSRVALFNYYGPTEAAVWATRREVERDVRLQRLSSIGKPLPNVVGFIVGPQHTMHPPMYQPTGVYGELMLGGVQVARGYLNRPEATSRLFAVHAFDTGERIYHTGDRCRWFSDGEIDFGGRIDFQVKVRGQRIELGEIEHALRSQPSIIEAVVMLRTDLNYPALVAYVHPASLVSATPDGMQNALPLDRVPACGDIRQRLPAHMVPSLVVGVEHWPRTSSNKVDRKQLPLPRAIRVVATPTEVDGQVVDEVIADASRNIKCAVFEHLKTHLHIGESDDIDSDSPLMELGLHSFQATLLMRSLSDELGTLLPATMCFSFPTAKRLAAAINARLLNESGATTCADVHPAAAPSAFEVTVGSIGGLVAGGATCTRMMWQMIACAHDTSSEVPANRWDVHGTSVGFTDAAVRRCRFGAFADSIQLFDHSAFQISNGEAAVMDPSQRSLLEEGYATLVLAGYRRRGLEDSIAGVFVGATASDHAERLAKSPSGQGVYAATAAVASIASGRLSYVLGLQGPCAAYDTACSAALTACHAGHRAVALDECAPGIVAGVNIMLTPRSHKLLAMAAMSSPRGRCHTFDRDADGYARGEAVVGAVLLQQDGATLDVHGCGVRQDGRSASLTAPNGEAQAKLLSFTHSRASVSIDALVVNEAHGTGTALGDPIEAGSLAQAVLTRRSSTSLPFVLGSVKASIAHAEACAGAAGMIGLSRAMVLDPAPNAQLRALNGLLTPHINAGTHIPTQRTSCIVLQRPFGGVSSFGFSGTIAHVILRVTRKAHTRSAQQQEFKRRSFVWRRMHHAFAQDVQFSSAETICRGRERDWMPVVQDHLISSSVVAPAASHFELVHATLSMSSRAARLRALITDAYLLAPLSLGLDENRCIDCVIDMNKASFKIMSGDVSAGYQSWTLHSVGGANQAASSSQAQFDLAASRSLGCHTFHTLAWYEGVYAGNGVRHKGYYRIQEQKWLQTDGLSVCLLKHCPPQGTFCHPAILDAMLQIGSVRGRLTGLGNTSSWIPFGVRSLHLQKFNHTQLWAMSSATEDAGVAERAGGTGNTSGFRGHDIDLKHGPEADARAQMRGLMLRQLRSGHAPKLPKIYDTQWIIQQRGELQDGSLLLVASELAGRQYSPSGGGPKALHGPFICACFAALHRAQDSVSALPVLECLLGLISTCAHPGPAFNLHVLTSSPQSVCGRKLTSVSHAGLWGLQRVAVLEMPLSVRCIGCDEPNDSGIVHMPNDESQLVRHRSVWWAPRLSSRILPFHHLVVHRTSDTSCTHLVTGALGGLGTVVSRRLWQHYDTNLLLAARTGGVLQSEVMHDHPTSRSVRLFRCDTAEVADVSRVFLDSTLHGVWHLAGSIRTPPVRH